VQILGDCFKEKNIIRAAYAFEQARGPWQAPAGDLAEEARKFTGAAGAEAKSSAGTGAEAQSGAGAAGAGEKSSAGECMTEKEAH
jgi:hypothetical protein